MFLGSSAAVKIRSTGEILFSQQKAVRSGEKCERGLMWPDLHKTTASLPSLICYTGKLFFWTRSFHHHFNSNYKCNLGLLNDLPTMANGEKIWRGLKDERKTSERDVSFFLLHVTEVLFIIQVLFQLNYLFPLLSSFSFGSPHFLFFFLSQGWTSKPETPSESDVMISVGFEGSEAIRAKLTFSTKSSEKWKWNPGPTAVLSPPKETRQSLFPVCLAPPSSSSSSSSSSSELEGVQPVKPTVERSDLTRPKFNRRGKQQQHR